MGELMDEGYLNRSRLEWAAKKAYDPTLKEAAQVLLQGHAVPTGKAAGSAVVRAASGKPKSRTRVGIRLEEARSTGWPFRPLRGQPMGMLSDSRQLSLKDLVFAVENALDDRVRQAAIALLLVRLDQELVEPSPPAGALRVVTAGRSHAERRQLFLAMLEGLIAGAVLALAFGYTALLFFPPRVTPRPRLTFSDLIASPGGLGALALVILLLAGGIWLSHFVAERIFKSLDEKIEAYRIGQEGEGRVVDKAQHALDGDWVLFRNVVLPGRRRADLDIVLVGPPGVWSIEVKNLRGQYKNLGEAWEYRSKGGWKRLAKSPSRQARDGAIALAEFLKADGIKTYVTAAVAWANEESPLAIENPTVAILTMDRLEDEFANLWNGRRLEEQTRERIVGKLAKLCKSLSGEPW